MFCKPSGGLHLKPLPCSVNDCESVLCYVFLVSCFVLKLPCLSQAIEKYLVVRGYSRVREVITVLVFVSFNIKAKTVKFCNFSFLKH